MVPDGHPGWMGKSSGAVDAAKAGYDKEGTTSVDIGRPIWELREGEEVC